MKEKETTEPFYNNTIPSDWEMMPLNSLGKFSKGKGILKEQVLESGLPCIRYGEIYTTHDFIIKKFKSFISADVAMESNEIKQGDILFAGSGETIEEIGKAVAFIGNEKAYAGGDVIILSTNGKVNAECLSYILETDIARRQKRRLGQGNSVVHIYPSDLATLKLPLPPLPEQKAIAHILSLMDTAINKNNLLIAKKELQKKWLMQQLLSGKRRIKKFVENEQYQKTSLGELPVDWKLNSIQNILNPVRKAFIPEQNELYQQIGIRSHTKGLFYKEKVTGATLGDKSVFWIEPDCFIVNIVFAWEHAIAKTTEKEIGMIASHRFPMFKPKKGVLDLDYLLYYFKSLRGKHLLGLASPGGAGRNKTLGQSEFVKLQIPVPSPKEQTAIAQVLQAADKEIQLLKTKTEKLREQKKGMMQVLLTGKKRLKLAKT
jgi:type I restriction enzyme, S subunit